MAAASSGEAVGADPLLLRQVDNPGAMVGGQWEWWVGGWGGVRWEGRCKERSQGSIGSVGRERVWLEEAGSCKWVT